MSQELLKDYENSECLRQYPPRYCNQPYKSMQPTNIDQQEKDNGCKNGEKRSSEQANHKG